MILNVDYILFEIHGYFSLVIFVSIVTFDEIQNTLVTEYAGTTASLLFESKEPLLGDRTRISRTELLRGKATYRIGRFNYF